MSTSSRRSLIALILVAAVAHLAAQPPAPQRAAAFDVSEKSILELQQAMASGQVTSRQLVEAFLARIEAYDQRGPRINAFVTLNPHARDAADALDRERAAKGPRGPLHGIPIVVKDNYNTADMPTTGSTLGLAEGKLYLQNDTVAAPGRRARAGGTVASPEAPEPAEADHWLLRVSRSSQIDAVLRHPVVVHLGVDQYLLHAPCLRGVVGRDVHVAQVPGFGIQPDRLDVGAVSVFSRYGPCTRSRRITSVLTQ